MAEGPRMVGNSWFMSLVLWSNKVQIKQEDDKKNNNNVRWICLSHIESRNTKMYSFGIVYSFIAT